MPRYDFVSPGAAAGNAIQQFLAQREAQQRQQMLDELFQQKQAEELRLRGEDLSLRRAQENRVAEAQRAAAEELATERGFRRATTIAGAAVPGDPADEPTAALLREHGYGSQIQQTPPTQGPLLSEDESGIPTYAVTPGILALRGGSQYLSARAAADERRAAATEAAAARAAEGQLGRESREDIAAANRETREQIAQMAQSNNAATRALANELQGLRIDQAREKLETTRTTRETATEAARQGTQNALALAERLETHPGLGWAAGNVSSRTAFLSQDATDFNALRDQLVAALTLPNLGALKGPMSDKDILFVKQLATRLQNPRISEPETRRAITEARTFLENKLGAGASPMGDGEEGPAVTTLPPGGPPPGAKTRVWNPRTRRLE